MALKDWKKVHTKKSKYQDVIHYLNTNNQLLAIVYKSNEWREDKVRFKSYNFAVVKNKYRHIFEREGFKTKSAALKFAKSYMRKH